MRQSTKTPISTDERDFYQKLRARIRNGWQAPRRITGNWAEYLMAAPDLFHLLCKLSMDKYVPAAERVKLAATITYFVSPLDLVPEAIFGVLGFADDIALTAYVLNAILKNSPPNIIKRHWAGEADVLVLIQKIIGVANSTNQRGVLGSGLWDKLKKIVG